MEQDLPNNQNPPAPQQAQAETYLSHGVESLVARDNPDDVDADAVRAQKRGSRRTHAAEPRHS